MSTLEDVNVRETVYWSDSQDVLFWIHQFSRAYKAYAANRIAKIQEVTAPKQWKFVPTDCNPADILSRGASLVELSPQSLWFTGPSFLMKSEVDWPEQPLFQSSESTDAEKRANLFTFVCVKDAIDLLDFDRFGTFHKAVRVLAWMLRFLNRTRAMRGDAETSRKKKMSLEEARNSIVALDLDEIEDARNMVYKIAQEKAWAEDLRRLEKYEGVRTSSPVRGFLPWIDESGVMRGTMRTTNAEYLSWDTIYPILLPRNSKITELVILGVHKADHHISVEHTVTKLRQKYFIPSIREAVRSVLKQCQMCKVLMSRPAAQRMGDLPFNRVNASRVFEKASLDFAGPFYIKMGRGKPQQKRWLCLFDCLAVRAIHLEIVVSMDTDSFILALNRFTHRRGVPSDLHADNGTNIVGGERELREYIEALSQEKIEAHMIAKGIRWHFQPAAAPHFGGAHEALVKSVKRSLWKTAGQASLTDDEFHTMCTKVEATMNSRPLAYVGTSLHDAPVLTPSDFIVGTHKTEVLPTSKEKVKKASERRWSQVEDIAAHFWRRWREEFVPTLGPRKRWPKEFENIKIGDIVHVLDIDTARGHWPMGRIERVFPGADGLVRAVQVRVGKKLYNRPVVKICPLGV